MDAVTLSIQDRLDIVELLARYNWAVDQSDGAAFAATFAEDGVFVGSRGSLRGREELSNFATRENLRALGLQHWTSNVVVDALGPGRARVRAYMLALLPREGNLHIERNGSYDDTLVCIDGRWVFQQRKFTPLHRPA